MTAIASGPNRPCTVATTQGCLKQRVFGVHPKATKESDTHALAHLAFGWHDRAVKRVLITGMSGTGKSSVIRRLTEHGYGAIDTDWNPEWEAPPAQADGPGWKWREDRIRDLLDADNGEVLFVSACVENQGKFYPRFDHIVLLSAPEHVTIERLATRTTNPYGKRPEEIEQVLKFKRTVEPKLRNAATAEIDTAIPLDEVVARVLGLVGVEPAE